MEAKDIIGLIFTFLLLVFVQWIGRPKKKQQEMRRQAPPPHPVEKRKEKHHPKKEVKHPPSKMALPLPPIKPRVLLRPLEKVKVAGPSKGKLLFSSKQSLRQGFIMQEILKRPYE